MAETNEPATDTEKWQMVATVEGISLDEVLAIREDVTRWENEIKEAGECIVLLDTAYTVGATDLRAALAELRKSLEARHC